MNRTDSMYISSSGFALTTPGERYLLTRRIFINAQSRFISGSINPSAERASKAKENIAEVCRMRYIYNRHLGLSF